MDNFKADILAEAGSEPIIAIVIGGGYFYHERARPPTKQNHGKVITWEEAAPLLDYEYSTGFGGSDCNPITAWTETRVIFVGVYDGATWLTSLPRNPVEHNPYLVGKE